MAQTASKRLRNRLVLYILFGLSGLGMLLWFLLRRTAKSLIIRKLKAAGFSNETCKFWVCVSAFETDGWTSRAYKEGHNLVGMTLAPSNTTATGLIADPNPEKLAQFASVSSAADDLVMFLTIRFKYPSNFASIGDLVSYMYARQYFQGDPSIYTQGVQEWYSKIYG